MGGWLSRHEPQVTCRSSPRPTCCHPGPGTARSTSPASSVPSVRSALQALASACPLHPERPGQVTTGRGLSPGWTALGGKTLSAL